MIQILLVFVASLVIIGSLSYVLYTYITDVDEKETFGVPSRTNTFVNESKNCDTPEVVEQTGVVDEDEVISMEDVMKLRNSQGETVLQKVAQKGSGMGYREGPAGPSVPGANNQASKPETALLTDAKTGVVWADDTPKPTLPPSHLMKPSEEPTMGGILPGLDRESSAYSSL